MVAEYKDIDSGETKMSIASDDRLEVLKQEMKYSKGNLQLFYIIYYNFGG